MNTHGRVLLTLAHRAMAGYDEDDYNLCEGEVICSTVLGWNFGDVHNECLIEALQQRCGFEPGDVRVVILDARPIHLQRRDYRLVDARPASSNVATSTSLTWPAPSLGPRTSRFASGAARAPSAIPDPVHHHHDDERADARQ